MRRSGTNRILLITLVNLFAILTACNKITSEKLVDNPEIDPNIKNPVEKNITDHKSNTENLPYLSYENSIFLDTYQNGEEVASAKGDTKANFKSFYYWKNDSLFIYGAYSTIGFSIVIKNTDVKVYNLITSSKPNSLSYAVNDTLVSRLQVPCTAIKLILSEIPDPNTKPMLYGVVEFNSNEYFQLDDTNNKRNKLRNNMKVYFKCNYLALPSL